MDDFNVGRFQFTNLERIARNGVEGRMWEVRELTDGGWVFRGHIFCPLSFSQQDIANEYLYGGEEGE